jgi:oligopeptide/dipeptide ABC transporter ATP-binding protein
MKTDRENSAEAVPILEIRKLCKDFHPGGIGRETSSAGLRAKLRATLRAVDAVDMEVHPGEARGIVGESGSGKTTLARCSLMLLPPTSGSIYFDGHDLASLSREELRAKRREFQMVFQDSYASLNPFMTVEDLILEPLRIHKMGTRETQARQLGELLDAVSLSALLVKRKPSELSGGQQQRVGIARALALNPRLLIADEPVSSLDASVQAQILNLLADLKRRYALTLILISHSLRAIHYICTRISVMYRGRIVEEAPAAVFFKKPRHPYSNLLLNTMHSLDSSRQKNAGTAGFGASSSLSVPPGCAFHPHCPKAFALCRKQIPRLEKMDAAEKVACFL